MKNMRKTSFKPTWGRIKTHVNIGNIVNEALDNIRLAQNDQEMFWYSGYIDGLVEGDSIPHRKSIDLLVENKNSIKEMELFDKDLFSIEISYKKGFISGLEKVLEFNRRYFEKKPDLVMLGLFTNESLRIKYSTAMQIYGYVAYKDEKLQESYYFSEDEQEIIKTYNTLKEQVVEVVIIVVSEDKYDYTLEKMKAISTIDSAQIFLIRDKDEINVKKIIDKITSFCELV